jgi:hypothetical protein
MVFKMETPTAIEKHESQPNKSGVLRPGSTPNVDTQKRTEKMTPLTIIPPPEHQKDTWHVQADSWAVRSRIADFGLNMFVGASNMFKPEIGFR